MAVGVEFFFDLSSPWTRLAFHNITGVLADTRAEIVWRPFLVGGVFNAVNPAVYSERSKVDSPRMKNTFTWLREWAELAGVAMHFPSPHHPLRSVSAMRFCCALEKDQTALRQFCQQAFEACFRDQENLDDISVLIAIADGCGLDGEALARRAATDDIKQHLRANTDEAIQRGAFGSPTLFVGGKYMYFGNDQLPLVRQRVLALQGNGGPA